MFSQRAVIAFLVLCSIIGVVYYIFIYDPLPPNVEIVVPKKEYPGWLDLSPSGDKMLYISGSTRIVFDLKTQQKQTLEKCGYSWWVTNVLVRCKASEKEPMILVNTEDFSQLPVQVIEDNNPQLTTILQHAGKIYRYRQGENDIDFFFVLSADKNKPNENYQINSTNIDTTLKGYTYTVITSLPLETSKPLTIYSPNQAYYMIWQRGRVTLYQATTNQQLAQCDMSGEERSLHVGGWAWDSSGVYYKGLATGLILAPPDQTLPIRKCVVPK